MPFSWKKTARRNRFSKLVADHLQSPKRGGSLVVETGFPTSLIDLYVRNRGRFRKSSKKQSESDSPTPLSSCSSSPSSGLLVDSHNITSSSSSSSYSLVDLNKLSSGGSDHREIDEIIEEDVDVGTGMVAIDDESKDTTDTEVELIVEMAKLNPVLVVALKVLVMAVIFLGTKRITMAITISAFVLLFLELMGKQLVGRLRSVRSRTEPKTLSESCFQEIKIIKSSEENTTLVCNGVLEIEEQIEPIQEVSSEKESDEVRSEVLMEIRHKSSKRAIMKSRMKKLVPKKLRRSSMGSKEDLSYGYIEEETVKSAQDDKALIFSSESDSKCETLRILKQNQDKIVEIEGRSLSSSSSSSSSSSEIDCNDKKLGRKLHKNSGCMALCLVVLVGLIGGRIIALLLALFWCLMLKKLQWRNVKFPIF